MEKEGERGGTRGRGWPQRKRKRGDVFFIKINWRERERSWFKEQLLLLLEMASPCG